MREKEREGKKGMERKRGKVDALDTAALYSPASHVTHNSIKVNYFGCCKVKTIYA